MNKYEKLSLMAFIMGCFSWHEGPSVMGAAMLIIGGVIFLNTSKRPTLRAAELAAPSNSGVSQETPIRYR